ncbi:hypothetical protein [Marinobacter lipolyticus]|uniref:hypothetical protein n=1 Tax=Marinobacter lipolyticus TaxID=209639 RepID=UPI003A8C98CA
MNYSDSVQKVLLRKITKAEQDLLQLKLDYCRFVYGLTHRSRVQVGGKSYLVRSVDVEAMSRQNDGSFSKPVVAGVAADTTGPAQPIDLGTQWELEQPTVAKETKASASRHGL